MKVGQTCQKTENLKRFTIQLFFLFVYRYAYLYRLILPSVTNHLQVKKPFTLSKEKYCSLPTVT